MFENRLSEEDPSNIRNDVPRGGVENPLMEQMSPERRRDAQPKNDEEAEWGRESEIVDGLPVNNSSNGGRGEVNRQEREDRVDEPEFDNDDPTIEVRQKIEGDNHGPVIGVLNQTVRRMIDSHRLSDRFVRECLSVYAMHPRIDMCLEMLRRDRVVVLVGDQGIGRHTAAVWILNKLGEVRLREVRREPSESFNIQDISAERKAGWILDLRSEDADVAVDFGRSLADSKELLGQANSYLVAVISGGLWKKVGSGGRHLEFILDKPKQEEVLYRHLKSGSQALDKKYAALWSDEQKVIDELKGLTPAEVVEWSEDIRNEHSIVVARGGYGEDSPSIPEENIENAVEARQNWFNELLEWYKEHPGSEWRNFMLAAAVLEGCRAGDVYRESQEIAVRLGEEQEHQAVGQQGPGIHELVSESEAGLENGDYLKFSKSGYARSVVEYFWVDRMHLRSKFIDWLIDISKSRGGEYDVATFERMGEYILRWCIQRREIGEIAEIISAWSSNDKLRQSARDLLAASALDPVLGKQARDKMLAWAKSEESTDIDVQAVVADACGTPLGAVYEKMMLYRLGFLAKSPNSKVQEATRGAFELLWNAEYARPRLREAITRWLTGTDRSRREAGRRSFIAIADLANGFEQGKIVPRSPGPAGSVIRLDEDERRFLVSGWRAVLEVNRPRPQEVRAFCSWMENALESPSLAAICVRVLLDALHTPNTDDEFNGSRIANLTRLLFLWAPAHVNDERAPCRDLVIDRAHMLDPMRQLESAPVSKSDDD